jgi:hypothetical protein
VIICERRHHKGVRARRHEAEGVRRSGYHCQRGNGSTRGEWRVCTCSKLQTPFSLVSRANLNEERVAPVVVYHNREELGGNYGQEADGASGFTLSTCHANAMRTPCTYMHMPCAHTAPHATHTPLHNHARTLTSFLRSTPPDESPSEASSHSSGSKPGSSDDRRHRSLDTCMHVAHMMHNGRAHGHGHGHAHAHGRAHGMHMDMACTCITQLRMVCVVLCTATERVHTAHVTHVLGCTPPRT